MKSGIFSFVALALLLVTPSSLQAGLVINSVASVVDSATTSTVNVSLYGINNGTGPIIENVSSFGVRVTIGGVTPTAISGATNAPGSSQWSAFTNVVAPTTSTNFVRFQAYNVPSTQFAQITGTSTGASTLIGTFSFTVNKTLVPQNFTTSASADTALTTGNVSTGNTGFQFFNSFGYTDIVPTTYNTGSSGPSAGLISPVPEPSSLALLGLASLGVVLRRRKLSVAC